MKSKKQLVLENKIRKMIREELLSEEVLAESTLKITKAVARDPLNMDLEHSKPILVGNNPVTVGLKTGTIYVYNVTMTKILARFDLKQLKLLTSMSKRKALVS